MAEMRYRVLGRSGISVSELCLGTMNFGGPTDEAEARRIIDHALENGVNFIDTANVYTEGRSEEIVGRALEGRRDRVILATKVANPVGHKGLNDRGLSRVHVMQAVEGSLRRLKTDYIDLYYVHRPDPKTPWEDVVRTFGNLVRQGKIRHWALSNVRGWQIAHICHLCRQLNEPEPVALQPYYNLMNRQPEVEVLPAARAYGLGVVPYSPVARGVLTGKYRLNEAPEPGSRVARQDKRIMETEWRPESLQIAEELKAHAEARGMTLIAFAVAWVLNNSAISSVIAGPRTLEQWKPYLGALEVTWTPEDEAIVDRFVVTGHPSTPGYNDPNYPIEGRFPTVKA
jgi:Predicted oxidoreductases (related to aryl-alcohol dehydrogenases)